MTETAERPVGKKVFVLCKGVTTHVGHNVEPEGFAPGYVEFFPGKPTETTQENADFLVKMDPHRFEIIKVEKKADEKVVEKTDAKAEKAAAKKPAKKAAKKAAKK